METRIRHSSKRISKKAVALSIISVFAIGLSLSAVFDLSGIQNDLVSRVRGQLSQLMRLEDVIWEEVGGTNLSSRVNKNLLWEVSKLKQGQEMLPINLAELEKQLLNIPWIESVQMQKKLPSTLLVKYTTHEARAVGIRKNKLWLISAGGKWIAAEAKLDPSLDLPLITTEDATVASLNWLETLDTEFSPEIAQVHEIGVTSAKMTAIVEIRYSSQTLRVLVAGPTKPRPDVLQRLKHVVQYLIKNNILVSAIDIRPGKKVVVNVGKGP